LKFLVTSVKLRNYFLLSKSDKKSFLEVAHNSSLTNLPISNPADNLMDFSRYWTGKESITVKK